MAKGNAFQDQIDQTVRAAIATFRKQAVQSGLRGSELAEFDSRMASFRNRFVLQAHQKLQDAYAEIGKDMVAGLEAEFGEIVRH